jgi:N-acetyl-anhydromuramoyl-L-alanine amidase
LKRTVWAAGWWRPARRIRSPNFGPRPAGTQTTLAIVHSISLPPGVYGGDAVERFFTNRLDASAHPYFEQIGGLHVSTHFFIRRGGQVLQFVSCDQRAWHAGTSHWRGRDNCNDWSIGIELEGLEGERFERAQYRALIRVLNALRTRYPLTEVVGHEHVAPGRKADPGARFEWPRLARALSERLATAEDAVQQNESMLRYRDTPDASTLRVVL